MAVTYNKLLKKLVDLKLTPSQLARQAKVSPNIAMHLRNDEYISMQTVEKICRYLNCGVDDILEFVEGTKDGD